MSILKLALSLAFLLKAKLSLYMPQLRSVEEAAMVPFLLLLCWLNRLRNVRLERALLQLLLLVVHLLLELHTVPLLLLFLIHLLQEYVSNMASVLLLT